MTSLDMFISAGCVELLSHVSVWDHTLFQACYHAICKSWKI